MGESGVGLGRGGRDSALLYTRGMAEEKGFAMAQPAYPVACYPVKPPPRGEDLPYSDGVPMESELHVKQANLLASSIELAWEDRTDFYVGTDMFVYFSEVQAKHNDFRGPDVFVVQNTVRKERRSWVVWEEDGRTPDVVIELTSPSTEHVDRGVKKDIYARVLHTAEYFLYDPFEQRLDGFRLDTSNWKYVPIEPDEQGRLECTQLGLKLGVVHGKYRGVDAGWLRWLDREGRPLPAAEELAHREAQRAEAETQRAEAEARRAEAAHSKLREAAERLLQTGMPPEQVEALLGIDRKT
jgi:Uma2 family endonuclease